MSPCTAPSASLPLPGAPGALFCTALLGAEPALGGACRRTRDSGACRRTRDSGACRRTRDGGAPAEPPPARWARSITTLRAWGQQARALRLAEHALASPGLEPETTAQLHYLSALCLDELGRGREAAAHYAKAIDHALAVA